MGPPDVPMQADAMPPAVATGTWRRAKPGLYTLVIVIVLLAAFAYRLRVNGIFACAAPGSAADSYLADCNVRGYGDFDHGSFWYGLDAPSRAAAIDADVLFLGSSRMQYAFSGSPTAQWAAAISVRPFLLGFSHTENVRFFEPLLRQMKPRAKAYVINVDRFFDDRLTNVTADLLRDAGTEDRYRGKLRWQPVHRRLCSAAPRLCGDNYAIYRARATGMWTSLGRDPGFVASGTGDGPPEDAERWPEFAKIAQDFVAALPVDRECVVLTHVPSQKSKIAEARAIAAALGRPLVTPAVDGLRTFDTSHLDVPSAERWAKAFFAAAGAELARCVHGPR